MLKTAAIVLAALLALHGDAARNIEHDRDATTTTTTSATL